jgi:hypothetical protein
MNNKFQVIIAKSDKALAALMKSDEALLALVKSDPKGGKLVFADSLEEAKRILGKHAVPPYKGGTIIPPEGVAFMPGNPNAVGQQGLSMRAKDDIVTAAKEFFDKVWYDRQQHSYDRGLIKRTVGKDVVQGMEDKYGKDNLGPYEDYEWGMINGKLSALRWVLGDEWDNLDT